MIACCENSARLCTKEPRGRAGLGLGVSLPLLTGRAGTVATGLDAQSRQIGEQPLDVEGRQRRVHVLGGLLQPGRGRGSKQNVRPGAGGARNPPAGVGRAGAPRPQGPQGPPRLLDPISQDRAGHLQELELYLPRLPGVQGAGRAGMPQSQGQTRPFQPQPHRDGGGPGGAPECQCEGLPIAEPLVSQELL